MTAKDIIALLATKHHADVFVPECKANSTRGTKHTYRLDAWAMRRSWAPWTTIGYEVKVSRSDFVQDDKWANYLALCHQFSFVCPRGLIDPKEVGGGAGLLWVTKNGRRLIAKVKAPRREIEPPVEVLIYILMSRAQIVHSTYHTCELSRSQRIEDWRSWLAEKEEARDIGYRVGKVVADRIAKADTDLSLAMARHQEVEAADALLHQYLGLGINDLNKWNREQKLQDALSLLPHQLVRMTRDASKKLSTLADSIERHRNGLGAPDK